MMTEAFALVNQQVSDEFSVRLTRQGIGLSVITSAALKQGLLASPFMAELAPYFPAAQTDAQRALQFARSTPGVTAVLAGMSQVAHVEENLALAEIALTDPDVIRGLFPDR
jgi:aryl-alcohol dehydrogenase-like predicted oxidoreductase